jgi:hypothetical protein
VSPIASHARSALLPCVAALALLPTLGGCVAAAFAVPVVAAAGIIGKNVRVRAATPVPDRRDSALATGARSAPGVTLTGLTELPPPSIAGTARDPWLPFVSYALGRASTKGSAQSALLAPAAATSLAEQRLACPESQPAVVVDLDSGPTTFAPGAAIAPSPGLAEGLARLREADIVVLWLSQVDANKVRCCSCATPTIASRPCGRKRTSTCA